MTEGHIIQICVVAMVLAYIGVAWLWSRKHPYPDPCPTCKGTHRVPDQHGRFKPCLDCYHEEQW